MSETTPTPEKKPTRNFFHGIAGSNVILPSGRTLVFVAGYLEVSADDTEALEFLEPLCKMASSGISEAEERAVASATAALDAAGKQVENNAAKVVADLAATVKK